MEKIYATAELLELDPVFREAYEADREASLDSWDRR